MQVDYAKLDLHACPAAAGKKEIGAVRIRNYEAKDTLVLSILLITNCKFLNFAGFLYQLYEK